MAEFFEPGDTVRNPEHPDWGLGQVQSVAGSKITVNFEHCGKLVLIAHRVTLDLVRPDLD